jgi:histidine triad (HIT) family protein
MQDSIFTKIIKGEIPSYKVYENDFVIAFMDIHPKVPGHVLVVPKKQVEFVWDLDDVAYTSLMIAAKKVAARIKGVLKPTWVGMQVEGVGVPHAHLHVFPFNNLDEYRRRADHNTEPDHTALADMAKKLAF